MGLMKGSPLWEEVKKKYPELEADSEIADEVLAHYSGKRGAERLRKAQEEALKNGNGILEKTASVCSPGSTACAILHCRRDTISSRWRMAAPSMASL